MITEYHPTGLSGYWSAFHRGPLRPILCEADDLCEAMAAAYVAAKEQVHEKRMKDNAARVRGNNLRAALNELNEHQYRQIGPWRESHGDEC